MTGTVRGRRVAAVLVLLAAQAVPLAAQDEAPLPEPKAAVGIAAQYGRAVGEFASYVRDGVGLTGSLTVGFGRGGHVGLRLAGQALIYGSQTRRYQLLPGISADVTTNNTIAGLMAGPQLSAGGRNVRVYGFGGVGFNYFSTTSEVQGSGTSSPFASSTNFDDITLAGELGGGLLVRVGSTAFVDFGARYVDNGRVNYVTREGVNVVGNNFIVTPVNSEANIAVYHVGVVIGLRTPANRPPRRR